MNNNDNTEVKVNSDLNTTDDTNIVMDDKNKDKKKSRKETIIDLQNSNKELNDKFLRLFAEFENYRKRSLNERIELIKTASEEIIVQLLPIVDDYERAIKSINETNDIESLKQGTVLIYNKIKALLEQKGVKELTTVGETFNTDFHEALTNIPAQTEEMKGKVVDEIQKGYLLNGKIIRYAKVIVAN